MHEASGASTASSLHRTWSMISKSYPERHEVPEGEMDRSMFEAGRPIIDEMRELVDQVLARDQIGPGQFLDRLNEGSSSIAPSSRESMSESLSNHVNVHQCKSNEGDNDGKRVYRIEVEAACSANRVSAEGDRPVRAMGRASFRGNPDSASDLGRSGTGILGAEAWASSSSDASSRSRTRGRSGENVQGRRLSERLNRRDALRSVGRCRLFIAWRLYSIEDHVADRISR
jgi:hypothetical protein